MSQLNVWARGVIAAGFDGLQLHDGIPRFGAYVLFARNVETLAQVRALADALRGHSSDGAPAAIAIDQEGGRVARLRGGVEAMPSAMALGAVDDCELTRRAGEQTAFDLRRAGCTLALAPVLDLALQPGNTVIGTRSFGSNPLRVAALGESFSDGLRAGGVVGCPKHYPGHGGTSVDSHTALPAIDSGAAELHERDLLPFAAVAPSARAMMGAHALVPAIDDVLPITLSAPAIALLRNQLHFDGAFVTDCLLMSALTSFGNATRAAIAALSAGADLLIISHAPEVALETVAAIEVAVTEGTLAAARLEEAYYRVLALRTVERRDDVPLDALPPHPGVGRETARRAVTLIQGTSRVDPTTATVVSFESDVLEGINTSAATRVSLRHEAPVVHELLLPLDPSAGQLETALSDVSDERKRLVVLARRAHLHGAQARAIAEILDRYHDAAVVSMLEPYDVPLFARASTVLATYGDDRAAIGGLADVLFGGSRPQGRLPVEI